MIPDNIPSKSGKEFALKLGQNDSIHSQNRNINLTIDRSNRRRSIEDNILMPNVKFVSPHSRSTGLDPASKTDRINNNDTYNSRLMTDVDSSMIEEQKYSTQFRDSANRSALGPGQKSNSSHMYKQVSGESVVNGRHLSSNRSFDFGAKKHRYSPNRENEYK